MVIERRPTSSHRPKFGALLQSDDPNVLYTPNNKNDNSSQTSPNYNNDDDNNNFDVCSSATSPDSNPFSSSPSSSGYARAMTSSPAVPVGLFYDNGSNNVAGDSTPYAGMSPWTHHHQAAMSPYTKSPWITSSSLFNQLSAGKNKSPADDVTGLIGSLEREEGHVYSLAVSGDMLYTGTDSKNIRVWRELNDFSGFKSNSGLVKAIVIHRDRIFTGHQDGKIRVWKKASTSHHKRIGSLPTTKDYLRSYVKVSRRHRNIARIRHFDAVSCMSLNEELGLLYSGSWDKTVKVWRIADSKCLESIVDAHDDAVNSVVDAGFDSLVFTGSADGTVKVWKREQQGKGWWKHSLVQTLLKQENAVTALAVNQSSGIVYCGSSDGNVHYWARSKNSKKNYQFSRGGVIPGHKIAVLCLAAAGNLVFSGSADNNISVWRRDVRRGGEHTCLSVLTGHLGPVKCLAVEEAADCGDEKGEKKWMVYSGSLDRSVKVWRVSENAPDLRELFLSEKDETSWPDISNYALTSTTY